MGYYGQLMRVTWSCAFAALLVLSAGDAFAQSRSAAMTVSVTVVRSGVRVDAEGTAANGTSVRTGSAENPTPAVPHETETEVAIAAPSASDAATSIMMVTINY